MSKQLGKVGLCGAASAYWLKFCQFAMDANRCIVSIHEWTRRFWVFSNANNLGLQGLT